MADSIPDPVAKAWKLALPSLRSWAAEPPLHHDLYTLFSDGEGALVLNEELKVGKYAPSFVFATKLAAEALRSSDYLGNWEGLLTVLTGSRGPDCHQLPGGGGGGAAGSASPPRALLS